MGNLFVREKQEFRIYIYRYHELEDIIQQYCVHFPKDIVTCLCETITKKKTPGEIIKVGCNYDIEIPKFNDFIEISIGSNCAAAIRKNGELVVLFSPFDVTEYDKYRFVSISCCGNIIVALTNRGQVVMLGDYHTSYRSPIGDNIIQINNYYNGIVMLNKIGHIISEPLSAIDFIYKRYSIDLHFCRDKLIPPSGYIKVFKYKKYIIAIHYSGLIFKHSFDNFVVIRDVLEPCDSRISVIVLDDIMIVSHKDNIYTIDINSDIVNNQSIDHFIDIQRRSFVRYGNISTSGYELDTSDYVFSMVGKQGQLILFDNNIGRSNNAMNIKYKASTRFTQISASHRYYLAIVININQ
jgi:hypothetical protein